MPASRSSGRRFSFAHAQRQYGCSDQYRLVKSLALGMSVVETVNHAEHTYFDAPIMLLTFLLVGRYLDQSMRRRTRAGRGNLAALKAETCNQVRRRDEISQVPVAAIHPGDIVLVAAG